MDAFGMITLGLIIYIISTMPTKKDFKRVIESSNGERAKKYKSALRNRLGTRCTVTLSDATVATDGINITGTLQDVDDEWALFAVEQKKGGTRLTAIRLDSIDSLEEK